MSRANCVSVLILLGMRLRRPILSGRMSWRAADSSVITITPSETRVLRAGRSFGIRNGHKDYCCSSMACDTSAMKSSRTGRRHVTHSDRVAEIVSNRLVEGDAMMEQLLEAPDGEAIRIDILVIGNGVHRLVLRPLLLEKLRLVVHGLGCLRKRSTSMRVCSGGSQCRGAACSQRGRTVPDRADSRVHDLAQAAAGVADEIAVLIDVSRLADEGGNVEQGSDLGLAVLVLARAVFGKGDAALRSIAGFAQVSGQRLQMVEGDVRLNVYGVGQKQVAQEGTRIASRLKLSTMCSPM